METIAAMVRDTQENGSNAVEGDTEDGFSLTNRQQVGSNDTQSFIASPFRYWTATTFLLTYNSIEGFRRKSSYQII
jgi:hypothetical protein